jgi:hypothetical protein
MKGQWGGDQEFWLSGDGNGVGDCNEEGGHPGILSPPMVLPSQQRLSMTKTNETTTPIIFGTMLPLPLPKVLLCLEQHEVFSNRNI